MRSTKFRKTPLTEWLDQLENVCVECGRKFDMQIENDSAEWNYGHDCEA
jgi:hypothetical protein